MSRLRVFRQTGWFIAGLMTGLPATAAPAEASSMAGVAVQAVRDDYPALSVLKAVVQPLRVDLLRHPTGIIIPVAALRPPRIMVCHHPPGVLRIISKPANLRPAAVIHRPQFSAGRVRVARQRRSRLFIRVGRVVCQPHRLQPDTVIGTVLCTGGQRVGENLRRGNRTGTGRGG